MKVSAALRRLKVPAGYLVAGLGLVGLVVPIIPGVVFIMAGAALIGTDHPWLKSITDRLRSRLKQRMTI